MEKEKDIILSAEQIEQQEKRDELFILMKSISKKINSQIIEQFIDLLNSNEELLKECYLLNQFIAIMKGTTEPKESDYEYYDTDDGKIEAMIRMAYNDIK